MVFPCRVRFTNGLAPEKVFGNMFMYAGDQRARELAEDRKSVV